MKPSIQSAIAVITLTLMASNHALLQRTCKAAQKSEVTTQGSTTAFSTKQASDQIPGQNLRDYIAYSPFAGLLSTWANFKKGFRKKNCNGSRRPLALKASIISLLPAITPQTVFALPPVRIRTSILGI